MSVSNRVRAFGAGTLLVVSAGCSDRAVVPTEQEFSDLSAMPAFPRMSAASVLASAGSTISLTPQSATVLVGKTLKFEAKNIARKRLGLIFWVTDAPDVISISQSGMVTGLKAGTANIAVINGVMWTAASVTVSDVTPGTPTPPNKPTTPTPPAAPTPPTTPTTPTVPAPPPTPSPPVGNTGWTFCTNAGAMCDFVGLRDVRFGPANGPYVTVEGIRSVPCAPYGFNNVDPAPGKPQHCDFGPIKTTTLTNPKPGMSGLNPSVVTVPLGSSGATTARTSSGGTPYYTDGSGSFRTICSLVKFDFIDPIVYPGQANSSHLHVFFGNGAVNPSSTNASLASSGGSTCLGGTLNRSAYWTPAMFDSRNGEIQVPDAGTFYYKTGYRINPSTVVAPPVGLRMIAGDKNATGGQSNVEWQCRDVGGIYTTIPRNCPIGSAVRLVIHFPQCWDGKNLDSPDHKSHMAQPNYRNAPQYSTCPSTHPVTIPVITEIIDWPVTAGSNTATWRLTSDMYSVSSAGGLSAHADWMNGWDPSTIQRIVTQCLNKGLDCGVGMIGNGTALTF